MQKEKILTEKQIRRRAKSKLKSRNKIHDYEYKAYDMDTFIDHIYSICDVNVRGNKFVEKLKIDMDGIIKPISPVDDDGDISCGSKKFEVKLMYSLDNGKDYRFTNIRPYQNFDYFIFALVDCHNDFNKRYYCIEKDDFLSVDEFKLKPMHGTKKINEENKKVGLGCNVKKEKVITSLNELNVLEGTSYQELAKFFYQLGIYVIEEKSELITND